MPTNGNGTHPTLGVPPPLSAKQRDDQRLQIIHQLNANTMEIGRLIKCERLSAGDITALREAMSQLRTDLDALAVAHAALLAVVQAMRRPWYQRIAARFGF